MKKVKILSVCLIAGFLVFSGCIRSNKISSAGPPAIIPVPDSLEFLKGNMKLTSKSRIIYSSNELTPLAAMVSGEIGQLKSLRLAISPKSQEMVI